MLICLAGFFVTPVAVLGQLTDTTGSGQRGALRIYKYSARTSALGDATVGDPNDISVININPAGLSFVADLKMTQLNISHNWNNNVVLENLSLPPVKWKNQSIAAQFSVHHDRGLEGLNVLGSNPMPTPKVTMYQVDVVYSFTVGEVLSLGILNNLSYAENSIARYMTYYPTLGMMYYPSSSISYGLVFRGLGRSVTYSVESPTVTTLGSQDLRESLELGATLNFPVDTEDPYLSISLANEKRFGEDGIWYKGGVELKSIQFLTLRTGLIFQPETDLYAPRFGIGISSDVIQLDYAISYVKDLYERFHQLGLTIHLDRF